MKYFNVLLLTAAFFMNVSFGANSDGGDEPLSKKIRTAEPELSGEAKAISLANLGSVSLKQGNHADTVTQYEAALAMQELVGETRAKDLANLGIAYVNLGGAYVNLGIAYVNLGRAYTRKNNHADAVTQYKAALALAMSELVREAGAKCQKNFEHVTRELNRKPFPLSELSLVMRVMRVMQEMQDYQPNEDKLNFILAVQDCTLSSEKQKAIIKINQLKKILADNAVRFRAATTGGENRELARKHALVRKPHKHALNEERRERAYNRAMARQSGKTAIEEIKKIYQYSPILQNTDQRLQIDIAIECEADFRAVLQINAGFVVHSLQSDKIGEYFNSTPSMPFQSFGLILKKFTNLKELDFSNEDHTQNLNYLIPHIAKHINQLKSLKLRNASIDDERVQLLALAVNEAESSSLEVLDLSENQFGDVGMQALAPGLAKAKNIRELELGGNNFSFSVSFVSALKKLTCLEKLSLWRTGVSVDAACEIIPSLPNLQSIDLSDNYLEISGFKKISKLLPSGIKRFEFRDNSLNDRNVSIIVDVIQSLSHLKDLDLSYNNFSDDGVSELEEKIYASNLQTEVCLDSNEPQDDEDSDNDDSDDEDSDNDDSDDEDSDNEEND